MNGPTRSRARCRPPRRSGAISSAPSTRARNSSITGSSWRCTNGRGSRPTTRSNAAIATRAESMDVTKQSPRAADAHQRFLFTGAEDLHRLPQGHRAQAARHAGRAGLAVAPQQATARTLKTLRAATAPCARISSLCRSSARACGAARSAPDRQTADRRAARRRAASASSCPLRPHSGQGPDNYPKERSSIRRALSNGRTSGSYRRGRFPIRNEA